MITSFQEFVPLIMGNGASLRTGIKVKEMGCRKVLLVHGQGMKKSGIADNILENLQKAGIETVRFEGVVPDPPDTMMEEAAATAREAEIDGIVAVGGGSALDTAKGINVLINNEPPLKQYFGVQKELNPGVPLIMLPTTSGTGSEVTSVTVITCTSEERKDSIISPVCLSNLAILDPELTLGMSPRMTTETGADALAHAVESLTGGQANPLSDALAREAIRTIKTWLPEAYHNGDNMEAREKMMYASMYAGMAFANSMVHLGHSIGHTLGAKYHLPHGIACAITLPEVIKYAAVTEREKVQMVCECLGEKVAEDANYEQTGATARDALRSFFKALNVPNMQELDIPREDIAELAPLVVGDSGMALAPYIVSANQVAEILQAAYDA